MAKHQAMLFLLLVHLLMGQGSATDPLRMPNSKCDCMVEDEKDQEFNWPKFDIFCNNITTVKDAACFRAVLGRPQIPRGSIRTVQLQFSNLDLLHKDLFLQHNVSILKVKHCTVSTMSYPLFCSQNRWGLFLINVSIPGSELIPGGFQKCSQLVGLQLENTGLADIPSGSFQGLDKLKRMTLGHNRLRRVPDLHGLEASLELLELCFNPIESIAKDAFRNMKKLKTVNLRYANVSRIENGAFDALAVDAEVFLEGNPLHCDCSSQWLQAWLRRHPTNPNTTRTLGFLNDIPHCAFPVEGPLNSTVFCTSSMESSALSTSQKRSMPNILTIAVLLMFYVEVVHSR